MKKILDALGFKSVSALRKAVKNGDSNALEFLELLNEFLKGGIKSEDIIVRGKVDFLNYMNIQMGYLKHEEFKVVFLNSSRVAKKIGVSEIKMTEFFLEKNVNLDLLEKVIEVVFESY